MNGNQHHTEGQIERLAERASEPGPNRHTRQAMGVQSMPPWTEVRHKMPPNGAPVLAFGQDRGFEVLCLRSDKVWETASDGVVIEDPDYNPTHWMPLPAKPRGR